MQNKFTEEDYKKAVKLFSVISSNPEYKLKLDGFIEFYNLLDWAKKDLLPKIENHIMEIKSVKQVKKKEDSK